MLGYSETDPLSHGIKMAAEKKTDAEQCNLSIEPAYAAALDKVCKKEERPEWFLKLGAKKLGLKKYKPRGKGRPAKPKEK